MSQNTNKVEFHNLVEDDAPTIQEELQLLRQSVEDLTSIVVGLATGKPIIAFGGNSNDQ